MSPCGDGTAVLHGRLSHARCKQHNVLLNSVDYFQLIPLTPESLNIRNLS